MLLRNILHQSQIKKLFIQTCTNTFIIMMKRKENMFQEKFIMRMKNRLDKGFFFYTHIYIFVHKNQNEK